MSLHDILMERAAMQHPEFRADYGKGAPSTLFSDIADGVVKGIQAEQQRVQAERDAERQQKQAIAMYTTMKGKDSASSDLIPELTIKSDGTAQTVIRSAKPTEMKARMDIDKANAKAQAIDNYINGNMSDVDLLRNMGTLGLSDSEFEIATQARRRLRDMSLEQSAAQAVSAPQIVTPGVPEGFKPVYGVDKFGTMAVTKLEPVTPQDLKAEQELRESRKVAELQKQRILDGAKDTVETIAEIKKDINNFGLWGALPSIPGTPRVNWEANVDKLLSKKIVDLMSEMKNASKTGATGFGQLNQEELKVLKNASTALKRTMNPSDAMKYLGQMEVIARKVLGEQQTEAPMTFNSPEEADNSGLPAGTIVIIDGRRYEI